MESEEKRYLELLKSLTGNLEQLAAYQKEHPAIIESLEKLKNEIFKISGENSKDHLIQKETVLESASFQNIMDGTIVVDDQGKVLMMNPAAEEIYGLSLANAGGIPLPFQEEEMIIEIPHLSTGQQTNQPFANKESAAESAVILSGDKKIAQTLKASGAVIQNEEGKVIGMITAPIDAIKLKEIELLKRDFVAHITHELRAPLSSIRAALEILAGQISNRAKPEDIHLIDTAVKNSDRLSSLINSILDFSKIESGQMTVYPKKTEAKTILEEAADSVRPWARKKEITLTLFSKPDLPSIWADPNRTIQVLINLLSNAIKFTPSKGAIVARAELSNDKKAILFSVSDTGYGIPPKDHQRVFEKFVQLDTEEKRSQGTGLGLPIAKSLIELQNGKIWVESSGKKGSTFFLTLPIYSPPQEDVLDMHIPQKTSFWKRVFGLR